MRIPAWRVAALAGLIASGVLSGGADGARAGEASQTVAATEITTLRDGAGRDLTVGRCIICHSVEYIPSNAPVMNRGAWQKSIQKMRDKFGAPITDGEAQQILDYLAANYSGKS